MISTNVSDGQRNLDNPEALAKLILAKSCSIDQTANKEVSDFFGANPLNDFTVIETFLFGVFSMRDFFERTAYFSTLNYIDDLCNSVVEYAGSICKNLNVMDSIEFKRFAIQRQNEYRKEVESHLFAANLLKHPINEDVVYLLAARFFKHANSKAEFYKESSFFSNALFSSAQIESHIVELIRGLSNTIESAFKTLDSVAIEKLFKREFSLLDFGLRLNTGVGNIVSWAINIACFLITFFSFKVGLYVFFGITSIMTLFFFMLVFSKGRKDGSDIERISGIEEYDDYHFFIQNPQVGHSLSAIMSGLRLTAVIWGLYSVFFHSLWWPILISIALWFGASIVSVKLNPIFFMRDRLERANQSEQRKLAKSIRQIFRARKLYEQIVESKTQKK